MKGILWKILLLSFLSAVPIARGEIIASVRFKFGKSKEKWFAFNLERGRYRIYTLGKTTIRCALFDKWGRGVAPNIGKKNCLFNTFLNAGIYWLKVKKLGKKYSTSKIVIFKYKNLPTEHPYPHLGILYDNKKKLRAGTAVIVPFTVPRRLWLDVGASGVTVKACGIFSSSDHPLYWNPSKYMGEDYQEKQFWHCSIKKTFEPGRYKLAIYGGVSRAEILPEDDDFYQKNYKRKFKRIYSDKYFFKIGNYVPKPKKWHLFTADDTLTVAPHQIELYQPISAIIIPQINQKKSSNKRVKVVIQFADRKDPYAYEWALKIFQKRGPKFFYLTEVKTKKLKNNSYYLFKKLILEPNRIYLLTFWPLVDGGGVEDHYLFRYYLASDPPNSKSIPPIKIVKKEREKWLKKIEKPNVPKNPIKSLQLGAVKKFHLPVDGVLFLKLQPTRPGKFSVGLRGRGQSKVRCELLSPEGRTLHRTDVKGPDLACRFEEYLTPLPFLFRIENIGEKPGTISIFWKTASEKNSSPNGTFPKLSE